MLLFSKVAIVRFVNKSVVDSDVLCTIKLNEQYLIRLAFKEPGRAAQEEQTEHRVSQDTDSRARKQLQFFETGKGWLGEQLPAEDSVGKEGDGD